MFVKQTFSKEGAIRQYLVTDRQRPLAFRSAQFLFINRKLTIHHLALKAAFVSTQRSMQHLSQIKESQLKVVVFSDQNVTGTKVFSYKLIQPDGTP